MLLDEMYSPDISEQLRARGHDAVSVHDPEWKFLEGAEDADVFGAALVDGRSVVTENVPDYRVLEAAALAAGQPSPEPIFTTDRQFPRGAAATVGSLVLALDALMQSNPISVSAMFLKPLA